MCPELGSDGVVYTVWYERGAAVEKYERMLTCTDTRICLCVRGGRLTLEGTGLSVGEMDAEGMTICGKVQRVFYEEPF